MCQLMIISINSCEDKGKEGSAILRITGDFVIFSFYLQDNYF